MEANCREIPEGLSHHIAHGCGSRIYATIPGVAHTQVIHQKKKINGKWVEPFFTRRVHIRLPTGPMVQRIAGTQTIDGMWTLLRKETRKFQGNFELLDQLVRVVQWRTWARGRDQVLALGETCSTSRPIE